MSLHLPLPDGSFEHYEPQPATAWERPAAAFTARRAYAAAHVVPSVTAENVAGAPAVIDWDSTLAFRHELWSYGLGVADAMDTAQRGMGLDWGATQELIKRSAKEAAAAGGDLACGAGTDQLDPAVFNPASSRALDTVLAAYREQADVVASSGATVILMASRALAQAARGPEDYLRVYSALLAEADRPVILHWLGTMFDRALAGYWGSDDVEAATETFLQLIRAYPDKVDGVKVSLLDADHEIRLRQALPAGVRLYTGDDFNYPQLIQGDGTHHSDALLGIFAAIAPVASAALQAYEAGEDRRGYELLKSTETLGRHIFQAPTYFYKTGVAFLSWLNGAQPGFQMVGGLHAGRSVLHLSELFRLADKAGLLKDPDLAAARMQAWLGVNGAAR
ncbi:DUF993 family protein [Paenarthrobacter sp. DKR-5]|uniref:dihydrodipicolinate synthase family protein n=1 Tax=Paenarthrobacter sp. DKR-5 TaxID=2835535 RepID=UPI001BDBB6AF|nr:dihydrodipicolinate synthase family protein [Paenarthrobacter sp. DKR-5]MBT1002248.1 DUF993 family protein [Paenarthrobacter sp. DKR-5]